ncbi:MAG: toprim domain-containing protein [Candidatus Vogelbacteria bacterium]|jgi:recombination protein RecR|nr:toprim domain-containing protein [Candidatus Vogelbacteria bacterium]
MSNPIVKLSELFVKFPGIGPRQARRFVYYLLHHDRKTAEEIIEAIQELKASTLQCSGCFRFFTKKNYNQAGALCEICSDETADHSTLIIVEKDADLENVRKAGSYNGLYFVLGGLVPILDKNPEARIRIGALKKRIETLLKNNQLKELILALSASVEGDNTADYVHAELRDLATKNNLTISTLGRGLSTGTELEYSDPDTIREALRGRRV